jgi:hypothetical protein
MVEKSSTLESRQGLKSMQKHLLDGVHGWEWDQAQSNLAAAITRECYIGKS